MDLSNQDEILGKCDSTQTLNINRDQDLSQQQKQRQGCHDLEECPEGAFNFKKGVEKIYIYIKREKK